MKQQPAEGGDERAETAAFPVEEHRARADDDHVGEVAVGVDQPQRRLLAVAGVGHVPIQLLVLLEEVLWDVAADLVEPMTRGHKVLPRE